MKLSKLNAVVSLLAAVFLAFSLGWFARGATVSQPLRIETERTLETAAVALPAPTATAIPEKIDINTADAETLQTLPGIGEKRAADIIAYREANGPFRYPEDITRVSGIGEDTLEKLLPYITTGEETQ